MESWRDELYHHGIKGQRWGVRRYQNPDGTLTDAGKKRYSYGEVSVEKSNFTDIDSHIISKGNKSLEISTRSLYDLAKAYEEVAKYAVSKIYDVPVEEIDKRINENPEMMKDINAIIDVNVGNYLSKAIDKYGKKEKKVKDKVEVEVKAKSQEKESIKPKYTQEQAINKIYDDLEKKYPNYNSFSQEKQDRLFFDYANKSGLYEYI